jgi:hypothetical protein
MLHCSVSRNAKLIELKKGGKYEPLPFRYANIAFYKIKTKLDRLFLYSIHLHSL